MSDDANPPRRRVWKYVLFLGIAGLAYDSITFAGGNP